VQSLKGILGIVEAKSGWPSNDRINHWPDLDQQTIPSCTPVSNYFPETLDKNGISTPIYRLGQFFFFQLAGGDQCKSTSTIRQVLTSAIHPVPWKSTFGLNRQQCVTGNRAG
jgi:hypothetical protein